MKNIKRKTNKTMISTIIAASLLFSATGYSSIPKSTSQEMIAFSHPHEELRNRSTLEELPAVTYDDPNSTAQILPTAPDTFALTMPNDFLAELDAQDLRLKKQQLMYSALVEVPILATLTAYYACTTDSSTWLSGAMASFCTNAILTTRGNYFAYRELRNTQRRKKLTEKQEPKN